MTDLTDLAFALNLMIKSLVLNVLIIHSDRFGKATSFYFPPSWQDHNIPTKQMEKSLHSLLRGKVPPPGYE